MDHNKKSVLITGGSRGIGKGIAKSFALAGFEVSIAHWNDHEQAKRTVTEIEHETGVTCLIIEGDLREKSEIAHVVDTAIANMGKIDVLVNNAGICIFDPITSVPIDHLETITKLNFQAPILLMKAVSQHMIERGIEGNIINITSSRAERAYPGDAIYGGLKAGLKRASESVALDLAPYGIRVNCIAPGAILVRESRDWDKRLALKIPLGRIGTPKDIGDAAVWLTSEQSSYITGINVRVDGGLILPGTPE